MRPVFVLAASEKGILKSIRLKLTIPFGAAAVHQSLARIPQTSRVWVNGLNSNVALLNAYTVWLFACSLLDCMGVPSGYADFIGLIPGGSDTIYFY